MRDLLIMALIGVGTLGMRAFFIVRTTALPASLERFVRHAKPAILAALVGGSMVGGEGGLGPGALGALAVAWILARRGASMPIVLVAGMAVALALPG